MEENRVIVGIDPGKSGGISFIYPDGKIELMKMPETETSIAEAFEVCKTCKCTAFLEKVHSMPKQGVASVWTFAQNYGTLLGILAALKITRYHVTPFIWQKTLQCLSKGDKNITKRRAQELFPDMRITHATADALLIGKYGLDTQRNIR